MVHVDPFLRKSNKGNFNANFSENTCRHRTHSFIAQGRRRIDAREDTHGVSDVGPDREPL